MKTPTKITIVEKERIALIHQHFKGKVFKVREVEKLIELSVALAGKYLITGNALGLFGIVQRSIGTQPAVYVGLDVDCDAVLGSLTISEQPRRAPEIKPRPTGYALDGVYGRKVIEHECTPRVILECAGGFIKRSRARVFVGGNNWEGM